MSYIDQIAYHKKRRDEVPNQELAALLAGKEDSSGIEEIASYLSDKNKSIQSDCLKVLYEIGYIKPQLIVSYVDTFLYHLNSRNNRMVWGSMIACANIAALIPDKMMENLKMILDKINTGTTITHVWGIYTLINTCKGGSIYKEKLFPILLEYLSDCRPVDFAKRAESILVITEKKELPLISTILDEKKNSLSDTQYKRALKALKKY